MKRKIEPIHITKQSVVGVFAGVGVLSLAALVFFAIPVLGALAGTSTEISLGPLGIGCAELAEGLTCVLKVR
jgi:hypothetical protein